MFQFVSFFAFKSFDKLILKTKLHHWLTSPSPPFSTHTHTPPAQPPVGKLGAGDVRQRWRRRKQLHLSLARWRRGTGLEGWSEGVNGREEEREGRDRSQLMLANLPLFLSVLTVRIQQIMEILNNLTVVFLLIHAVCGFCWRFICLSVYLCVNLSV